MIVFEGATHNLHLKFYEKFNQNVAEFLNEKSKLWRIINKIKKYPCQVILKFEFSRLKNVKKTARRV